MELKIASLPVCVEHARHRLLRDDLLLRFPDDRPLREARKHPQLQFHKSEPPSLPPHLFPVEYFQEIRTNRDQYFSHA
jgi:hypothetical protein